MVEFDRANSVVWRNQGAVGTELPGEISFLARALAAFAMLMATNPSASVRDLVRAWPSRSSVADRQARGLLAGNPSAFLLVNI